METQFVYGTRRMPYGTSFLQHHSSNAVEDLFVGSHKGYKNILSYTFNEFDI